MFKLSFVATSTWYKIYITEKRDEQKKLNLNKTKVFKNIKTSYDCITTFIYVLVNQSCLITIFDENLM